MDNLLYVSMSGAEQIFEAQAMNANNLANVKTSGFKADLDQFRSQIVLGDEYMTRVYAMAERPATDFTPGSLIATGNDLDVAVKGEGWMSVQTTEGAEGLTRNGSLHVTDQGLLVNDRDQAVLGEGGPITIGPYEKLEIGVDGTISMIPEGATNKNPVLIDRIKLSNPDLKNLYKDIDGLVKTKDGSAPQADAGVKVTTGFLEGSNVNAVEAITRIIELARAFEINMKMMQTADQTSESETSTLSIA